MWTTLIASDLLLTATIWDTDQGASTAAANAASMDAQVTMSNGSCHRRRRGRRMRGALSDRPGIRALKRKSLRNEVEERPNAHYGVADQSDQQLEPPEATMPSREPL